MRERDNVSVSSVVQRPFDYCLLFLVHDFYARERDFQRNSAREGEREKSERFPQFD